MSKHFLVILEHLCVSIYELLVVLTKVMLSSERKYNTSLHSELFYAASSKHSLKSTMYLVATRSRNKKTISSHNSHSILIILHLF